jgi:hypothetical protein
MMLSRELRAAIQSAARQPGRRQYQLARAVGIHPVTLSDLMRGARDVERGESRIVALGNLLGIHPDDCFESSEPEHPTDTATGAES